jgi:hypothetical protein
MALSEQEILRREALTITLGIEDPYPIYHNRYSSEI